MLLTEEHFSKAIMYIQSLNAGQAKAGSFAWQEILEFCRLGGNARAEDILSFLHDECYKNVASAIKTISTFSHASSLSDKIGMLIDCELAENRVNILASELEKQEKRAIAVRKRQIFKMTYVERQAYLESTEPEYGDLKLFAMHLHECDLLVKAQHAATNLPSFLNDESVSRSHKILQLKAELNLGKHLIAQAQKIQPSPTLMKNIIAFLDTLVNRTLIFCSEYAVDLQVSHSNSEFPRFTPLPPLAPGIVGCITIYNLPGNFEVISGFIDRMIGVSLMFADNQIKTLSHVEKMAVIQEIIGAANITTIVVGNCAESAHNARNYLESQYLLYAKQYICDLILFYSTEIIKHDANNGNEAQLLTKINIMYILSTTQTDDNLRAIFKNIYELEAELLSSLTMRQLEQRIAIYENVRSMLNRICVRKDQLDAVIENHRTKIMFSGNSSRMIDGEKSQDRQNKMNHYKSLIDLAHDNIESLKPRRPRY